MRTKNETEFGGSDVLALEYIRKRGYCSYSSLVNVRDKIDPGSSKSTSYFDFGGELHSRFLEHKKIKVLPPDDEKLLKICANNLADNQLVQHIMKGAQVEQAFDIKISGVRLYGRIDALTTKHVGDLKTTSIKSRNQFIAYMDFLQPAVYLRATKLKEFYYFGVCKLPPNAVFVFSVNDFPERLQAANDQLDYLLSYLNKVL